MPNEPRTEPEANTLNGTIFAIGQALAGLDPGALADLRRMSFDGDEAGAAYFWRLAARHKFGDGKPLAAWARIVQMMAMLTEKGQADGKRSPHEPPSKENGWRGLGHALCDGGDPTWGVGESDPRPMLSEYRFARLLAARRDVRAELLERAIRTLSLKKPPGVGVNCTDLAWLVLDPDNSAHSRKLARDYYARLDRAQRGDAATDTETDASETGAVA